MHSRTDSDNSLEAELEGGIPENELHEDQIMIDRLKALNEHLPELAKWVIGPEGFPNLQILAYGNFVYPGKFETQTAVIGRNYGDHSTLIAASTKRFKLLDEDDIVSQGLLRKYRETLEACPVMPYQQD